MKMLENKWNDLNIVWLMDLNIGEENEMEIKDRRLDLILVELTYWDEEKKHSNGEMTKWKQMNLG